MSVEISNPFTVMMDVLRVELGSAVHRWLEEGREGEKGGELKVRREGGGVRQCGRSERVHKWREERI